MTMRLLLLRKYTNMNEYIIENTGQLKEHSIPLQLGWYFYDDEEALIGPYETEEAAIKEHAAYTRDE